MSATLMLASAAITAALILYAVGVFRERAAGTLKGTHVALFLAGLACDTAGTTIMTLMARTNTGETAPAIHGITGALAIALMLFHAVWACIVFFGSRTDSEASRNRQHTFHRLSTMVWLFWLVPYLIGLFMGMPMLSLSAWTSTAASVAIAAMIGIVLVRLDRRPQQSRIA